ncbi:MAG: glycerol-3-phosphate dehydrogenase/oxidase [Spirochaetia bacterium]|nr:glycerol-3-phosphate dehydrogenase/oxidase [Spirochaetia bacterium]
MNIKRNPSNLNQEFHIVVIGGGITGLAIAREAAERGLKTAIIEKNDFGCATSAATSKLIHGGLRYLENMEFGLVRESLRERKIMGNAAAHLVMPLPIILPVYNFSKPGKFMMRIGLRLYDLLSFDRNFFTPKDKKMPASRWISRRKVLELAPCMKEEGLKGGFVYYDLQSLHPERLSLAFLKTAVSSGAVAFNHMSADSFQTSDTNGKKRILSVHTTDLITGKKYKIRGQVFVNCTGPWLDYTLGRVMETPAQTLQRSQGIHILSKDICGKYAVLHRNEAGRHFFILPWMNLSLTGPTDTPFADHPDTLYPGYKDSSDLIHTVNQSLTNPIKTSGVKSILIGLRPLISSGTSTYKASRKSEIYNHAAEGFPGLFSVAGGKLTTSRDLGEQTVKKIIRSGELKGIAAKKSSSLKSPLFGSICYGDSHEEYEAKALRDYALTFLPEDSHRHLIRLYGTEHREILHLLKDKPQLAEQIVPELPDILAQVYYGVTHESARTLEDMLNRRLAMGTLGYPGDKAVQKVSGIMAKILKWTPAAARKEISAYKKDYPSIENVKQRESPGKKKKSS